LKARPDLLHEAPVPASLRAEIKELLVRELDLEGTAPDSIDDDAPLFGAGLGLDSLDALQLAMAVEERWGVAVPDGEGGKVAFASVAALADWVTAHRTP
jgi:acyl carrier protein